MRIIEKNMQKVVGHWSCWGDTTSVMWLQLPTKSKRNAVIFRMMFPFELCQYQYLVLMAWLHSCGQGSKCSDSLHDVDRYEVSILSATSMSVCRGQRKTPTTLKGCDGAAWYRDMSGENICFSSVSHQVWH